MYRHIYGSPRQVVSGEHDLVGTARVGLPRAPATGG